MIHPDLTERERQFEVVAKVAIQTGRSRRGNHKTNVNLPMIARQHFDLDSVDCFRCVRHAREFLEQVKR